MKKVKKKVKIERKIVCAHEIRLEDSRGNGEVRGTGRYHPLCWQFGRIGVSVGVVSKRRAQSGWYLRPLKNNPHLLSDGAWKRLPAIILPEYKHKWPPASGWGRRRRSRVRPMLYRAWSAMQKRPTRTIWIGALLLIFGAIIHQALTLLEFEKISSPGSASSRLSDVARAIGDAAPIVGATMVFDAACLLAGLVLSGVAAWRSVRR